LALALWPVVASGQTPAPPPAARPALPLLTTIEAIRALSQDEGDRGYLVRVRAVVTHFDEQNDTGLIIHDGQFGQYVMDPRPSKTSVSVWTDLRKGDVIEIDGHTERGGFAPNIIPTGIRRLGSDPLPDAKHVTFQSMLTGRHDCDYVEIVGVVRRAWRSPDENMGTLFAEVAYEDGVLRTTFWEHAAVDLERFIDARVRLRGNVGTIFGPTAQLRGVSLFAGRTREVEVLEAPPDPFQMPSRSIKSLYNYSAHGEVVRRIRISGVVMGYVPGRPIEISDFSSNARFRYVRHVIYVDDGSGGARVETEQPLRVRPGTVIDVAGFPMVTPARPILSNAIFRVSGEGPQPAPIAIKPDAVLTPDNDATLVRMEGRFLSMLTNPNERNLIVRIGETVFNANLEADAATRALEDIRHGSLVAVTGVYSYQAGPPPAFHLFLRTADDVRVLEAAPWWTLQHTAVMIVLLSLFAGGAALLVQTAARRKRQEYQAVLTERMRVGRELHDTLEQGLAGIGLQLEAVTGSLQTSPEAARQSLDVARQMLRYSLEEARRSVMDLRSQALESRDLAGALADMARQMTHGTPALALVQVEGTSVRLDAPVEHHLLRIGLEALTNAIKHSGASSITIRLRFGAKAVELMVEDNGRGMGQVSPDGAGSLFGLQGIRERVDKLGGALNLDSRPGEGTLLSVAVPIRPARERQPDEHGGFSRKYVASER
jgi:signal transduction histidine kinase